MSSEFEIEDDAFYFNYGKHEGEHIEDVPNTYLKWTVENIDKEYIVEACEAELKRRNRFGIYIEDEFEEERSGYR